MTSFGTGAPIVMPPAPVVVLPPPPVPILVRPTLPALLAQPTPPVLNGTTVPIAIVPIPGPRGADGTPGGAPNPISYDLTAASSWTQAHTFPYFPEVQLIEGNDVSVYLAPQYPDPSHVYLQFPTPYTGKVILR